MEQELIMPQENRNKSPFLEYIRRRISNNKNFLCCIVGATGSGKSYSALRLCQSLDPSFDIERCVLHPLDLLRLINSGKYKPGTPMMVDEAGIMINSRAWQSVQNKLFNYLLQSFRHKNFILFFTSPTFDFIDSASRKLFHSIIETKHIDKSRNVCINKPYLLQTNGISGKIYRKYLRIIDERYGKIPLKRLALGLPSKDLIFAYEKKKEEFTTKLYKEIEQELISKENKTNINKNVGKLMPNIVLDPQNFNERERKVYELKINKSYKGVEVGKIMNISRQHVNSTIRNIENKLLRLNS